MNKRLNRRIFAGIAGALSLWVLAACGNEVMETSNNGEGVVADAPSTNGIAINVPVSNIDPEGNFYLDHTTFRNAVTETGESMEGGILNVGLVQNDPPAGILNAAWSTTVPDTFIRQFFDEPMYQVGEDLTMNQEGVATWVLHEDGRTFTWTIHEDAFWSDGTPLTARDWVFAHEVIASPDYTGVRFDNAIQNVVGIVDFHNGDADDIAGLRIIDERTLEMEFYTASPSLLSGGVWANAIPYHVFGDIPVGEMQESAFIRETPIGFGPFVLETVVPGEAWSFVRNENYWRGDVNLDGVDVRVIHHDLVGQALRAGSVDIVNAFSMALIPYYFDMTNVEWIGTPAGSYNYLSFNLGFFEDGEVVPREDHPANSVYLRRAIWHAVDFDLIGRRLFSGLTWSASGLVPPSVPFFYNADLQRPEPSLEAARNSLAAGGFVDVDGDGYVEMPDGSPLVIRFYNSTPATDAAEAQQMFMVQSWREAGINIEVNNVEFVTLGQMMHNNEPTIDLFWRGRGLGWDQDPTGRYGRFAPFNFARYTSEELDALLEAINTPEALDPQVRLEAMNAWQEYMLDNVAVIAATNSMLVLPVNRRVQNFDLGSLGAMFGSGGGYWHEVSLLQEEAFVDGQ